MTERMERFSPRLTKSGQYFISVSLPADACMARWLPLCSGEDIFGQRPTTNFENVYSFRLISNFSLSPTFLPPPSMRRRTHSPKKAYYCCEVKMNKHFRELIIITGGEVSCSLCGVVTFHSKNCEKSFYSCHVMSFAEAVVPENNTTNESKMEIPAKLLLVKIQIFHTFFMLTL